MTITLKNYFEKDNMLNEVGVLNTLLSLQGFLVLQNKQLIMQVIHEMHLERVGFNF